MKEGKSANQFPGAPSNYRPSEISPKDSFRALLTPLRFLNGVGPMRAAQLEALGLKTVEDLLYHLPFRYDDRREIRKIQQVAVGKVESFLGKLVAIDKRFVPKRRRHILTGTLTDGTGYLGLVWYRVPPYMAEGLSQGQQLLVHGKVERGMGVQKRIVHPEFEHVDLNEMEEQQRKILPVYLRPNGIPLRAMRGWVRQALDTYAAHVSSCIPAPIAARQGLLDLPRAMREVHEPETSADPAALNRFASEAHRSIVFDEFFYLQLGLGLRKKSRSTEHGIAFRAGRQPLTQKMRDLLPFTLTRAQTRVIEEIHGDMQSDRPMQRLLQGDVGSGKTMVAWFAALRAIENGFQAVWMAPTELLAEQHFRNLSGFAETLGIRAALLTGSMPAIARTETLERISNGEIGFVVGTHALIQEGVEAPRLGLGVIDEQHRFGVGQRMAIQRLAASRKSAAPCMVSPVEPQPDILLMSATPIPRSLAMVLYGDMEVSSLDEMPPGRTPVATRLFKEAERLKLYELTRGELQKGHQAYVVYPLVEASEKLELRDATRMFQELSQGAFNGFRVGLIHGRMNAPERDEAMGRFKQGDLQVLVATTVIEVGIDVPNATVMVVEHAERFGLSQLHQLRGRVGRGQAPSHCLLIHYGKPGTDALARLRVMEKEHDGFKIAEADLELRGPGELLGTRQSGIADFRLANLVRDSRLLLEARKEALSWLDFDPALRRPESRALKEVLKHRWGGRLELGGVG